MSRLSGRAYNSDESHDRLKNTVGSRLGKRTSHTGVRGGLQHGLTLSQITRAMELPKSTVHSILLTFERSGYVQRDDLSGRYRLGLGLCRLANLALPAVSVREQAAPVLRSLMERTQMTVHMAALDHDQLVLIARLSPPGTAIPASWIGKRMDSHCTALGKAALARSDPSEVERLIRKHGMLRHNDNTIASIRRLLQDLEQVRRRAMPSTTKKKKSGCVASGLRCLDRRARGGGDQHRRNYGAN